VPWRAATIVTVIARLLAAAIAAAPVGPHDNVRGFMDALGIDRAHLVGQSLGGNRRTWRSTSNRAAQPPFRRDARPVVRYLVQRPQGWPRLERIIRACGCSLFFNPALQVRPPTFSRPGQVRAR
jgi:pimeloyl-ACP methyl ester carboxylesterase